jgi:hypothetical protein
VNTPLTWLDLRLPKFANRLNIRTMLVNSLFLLFGISMSNALPLDGAQAPRNIVERAKTYKVVNVDGGSPTPSPATTTLLQPTTVTVEVTTSTSTCTTTTEQQLPPEPTEDPEPVIVTVKVTETVSPTKFYDDGMWHTSYAVKTFEELAYPTPSP